MTVYTDLDRRLGLQLREHLKIASKITRMDSDGTPVAMDYIHAAHELVAELRRLGWREPEVLGHQLSTYRCIRCGCGVQTGYECSCG